MNSIKEQALTLIQGLPEDCTMEDVQDRISFMASIEAGLRDVREGRVISNEEFQRRVTGWLASHGLTRQQSSAVE